MYVCNVHGRWDTPEEDRKGMEWARGFFRDTAPYATGGVYVNFLTEDESDRVNAAYGANYQRLAEIKKIYDPKNLFRTNQNIRPGIRPAA
jgi:FAD/FMN-containing dehydrogenase